MVPPLFPRKTSAARLSTRLKRSTRPQDFTLMKVLILGASGLLGQALMREWSGDEVVGLSSSDVDIRDAGRVLQVVQRERPEWIVLSAAYTDVDGCESNQQIAFTVNRDGAIAVAEAARQTN